MKKIYIAIQVEENQKYYAFADAIRTGENLKPFIKRYPNAVILHLCESRKQAEEIAAQWNEIAKNNKQYLFDEVF
jgi:superfamily I DNA/RNA helicase